MRSILTIFTVLLVIPAPAGAAERWRAPQTVAAAPSGVLWRDTDVAVDDRGGLVAVWSSSAGRQQAVLAARATSGGRFGRPLSVRAQRGSLGDARVAIDEDRHAVIAYRRVAGGVQRVASRTLTAGGRLLGEQFLSGPGLAADFAREGGRGTLSAREIAAAAEAGDPMAVGAMARYEHRLGRALASIINVLDPDVIVLGGGLSNIGRLYGNVPAVWSRWVFSDHVVTRLMKNVHGDSSGVRGAAWLWP